MSLRALFGWLFAADTQADQQDEDAWLREDVSRDDELADLRDQVIELAADNLRLRLQIKRLPTPDWSRFAYLAARHAEVAERRATYIERRRRGRGRRTGQGRGQKAQTPPRSYPQTQPTPNLDRG
jgi:hypothetical protein